MIQTIIVQNLGNVFQFFGAVVPLSKTCCYQQVIRILIYHASLRPTSQPIISTKSTFLTKKKSWFSKEKSVFVSFICTEFLSLIDVCSLHYIAAKMNTKQNNFFAKMISKIGLKRIFYRNFQAILRTYPLQNCNKRFSKL